MRGSPYYAVLAILLLHPGEVQLDEDDDDYNLVSHYSERRILPSVIPQLLGDNVEITATVGETVSLPCVVHVSPSDAVAVHWNKKNRKYNTTTTVDILQDDRFQLVNGSSLQISALVPTDSGSYTCNISTQPELEVTHTLLVKSRPSNAAACSGKSGKWIDLGGDYCYLVELEQEVRWIEAVYNCLQEGGHLATLVSMEEVKRIRHFIKDSSGRLYIGLWKHNDGTFEWVDKSPSIFRNWARGEPNDKDETCVEIYQDSGKWNDVPCRMRKGYICSALKSQIASVPREKCPDSSSEWQDYGSDFCYIIQLYNETTSDEAAERCAAAGGSLASFHSVEEVSVVREQIKRHHDRLHIGFRQNSDVMFEWMDRSPVDLEFWDLGEPNDIDEPCGEIYPSSGLWNDIPCDKSEGYICSTAKVNSEITAAELPPSLEAERCGAEINADSGTIQSPNYPENYNPNVNCFWTITVPENPQIEISFQALQLEYGADCEYDYIEVLDGDNQESSVLRKLCGSEAQRKVLSSGNKMGVRFSSDRVNQRKGFLAEFKKVEQCGGNIVAEKGVIQSRNYPQNYPSNDICTWKITVPENNGVTLRFQAFEIEWTGDCWSDYVEILDGHDVTSPIVDRVCGFHIPDEIRSSGHKITVRFVSDGIREYYGFSAEFEKGEVNELIQHLAAIPQVEDDSACAMAIDYDRGLLVSPHYPEFYGNNEECSWTIRGAPASTISLRFKMFELERDSSCSYDYLEVHDGSRHSAPSLGKFCGGRVPDMINSTGNEMTVHFMSDSSHNSLGFTATFSNGGQSIVESNETIIEENVRHVVSDEGIVQSPNYPSNYGPNEEYSWKIEVPTGHQVVLTFTNFKVETHIRCAYDYVLVRDGYSHRNSVLAKLCGYEIPTEIRSSGNKMMIQFKSDSSVEYSGFSAEFKKGVSNNTTSQPLPDCGGEIYAESGTIQSPNYPSPYGPLQDCTWTITVPTNNVVFLEFETIELEYTPSCDFDHITVLDGDKANSRVLNTFCSASGPTTAESSKNKMTVKFKSDDSFEMSGFRATFRKVLLCGKTIVADKGILKSPNVTEPYKCSWSITVPENYTVLLKIPAAMSQNPDYESLSVEIRDGPDKFSDRLRYFPTQDGYRVRSSSNEMFVTFSVDGPEGTPEFYAEFQKDICGGDIVGEEGIITSPNYPDDYWPSETCTWKITIPEGNQVVLTFQLFDLEGGSCNYDYVEVYDGDSSSSSCLGRFCASNMPDILRSTSNKMYVKFVTDSSEQRRGFSAQFKKSICGGDIAGEEGIITSPNYPNNYPPSEICTWKITVPEGYPVVLTFQSFTLEGESCYKDYVEIYDGHSPLGSRIGKFCGSSRPQILRSMSNEMYVKFVSDSSAEYPGFSAQFKKDVCGGNLTAETGVITSMNFPRLYPKYSNCTWIITVPKGSTVNLQFSLFRLQSDGNCRYDYVEIFDGPDPHSSPLLRKMCGVFYPDPVQSTTNQLSVRFISDGFSERNGFSAEYSTVLGPPPAELPSHTELENILRQIPGIIFEKAQKKPKPPRGKNKNKKIITKRSLLETLHVTFKLH